MTGRAIAEVEATQRLEFVELLREGTGELNAAVIVGWSPAELRKVMADTEFAMLCEEARERTLEDIEKIVIDKARAGMRWACEMVLYTKGKHRGWIPPTHKVDINSRTEVEHRVVITAVESIRQLMAEGVDPADLQKFAAIEASSS